MFNFNLMNRALNDSNLSDSAFRMLYIILNNCSLNNSNSAEIHNGYFMKTLNKKERMIKYLTNELVKKGYIAKSINGTSKNKLANTYTLVEVNDTPTDSLCDEGANNCPLTDKGAINDAKNCILKNNIKINKKNNIFLSNNINIPDTDDANIDGSSDGRIGTLKNNIKINNKNIHVNIHENINTGNSDDDTEDLRIEDNINLNNENVMNNSTLEERLGTQPLDDNTTGKFENTGNKYPQEEQERYHRLFNNCKSQIEIWTKTHEYSCISIFDSYFKVIQYMKDQHLISDKQWEASQRHLLQRFMNLRNGYFNYIQNKKKHISSMEFNKCKNPQPPRQQNDQMEEAV